MVYFARILDSGFIKKLVVRKFHFITNNIQLIFFFFNIFSKLVTLHRICNVLALLIFVWGIKSTTNTFLHTRIHTCSCYLSQMYEWFWFCICICQKRLSSIRRTRFSHNTARARICTAESKSNSKWGANLL